MTKSAGGILLPADDFAADSLTRFKNFEQYEIDIVNTRNPAFHRKVFAFFNYCFAHQKELHGDRFLDERTQFELMRKRLTIKAGYYEQAYDVAADRIVTTARSLAYANMEQHEFESLWRALISASMEYIFNDIEDHKLYDKLARFFY